jgi:hypothetical protein
MRDFLHKEWDLQFADVTENLQEQTGEERYFRRVSKDCWISVLYRLTGFGYHEWETAIVFINDTFGLPRSWKDSECLIISGDRRKELCYMPEEKLGEWYVNNINGNRNSMETLMEALK